MRWFADALQRHGAATRGVGALVPTLAEWFGHGGYRGCAFINSVGEFGGTQPEVAEVARAHKRDMTSAIAALLPPGRGRDADAQVVALLVDGAIVRAQIDASPDAALKTLDRALKALATA